MHCMMRGKMARSLSDNSEMSKIGQNFKRFFDKNFFALHSFISIMLMITIETVLIFLVTRLADFEEVSIF